MGQHPGSLTSSSTTLAGSGRKWPSLPSMCQLRLKHDRACASCTQTTACTHIIAWLVKQRERRLLLGFNGKGSHPCHWHGLPTMILWLKPASVCICIRKEREEMALPHLSAESRPPLRLFFFLKLPDHPGAHHGFRVG